MEINWQNASCLWRIHWCHIWWWVRFFNWHVVVVAMVRYVLSVRKMGTLGYFVFLILEFRSYNLKLSYKTTDLISLYCNCIHTNAPLTSWTTSPNSWKSPMLANVTQSSMCVLFCQHVNLLSLWNREPKVHNKSSFSTWLRCKMIIHILLS